MFLNDKVVIGNKIKSYRKQQGYTQAELAEKIGVSEKHLSKIETGVHYPSISAFWNACEILNIPLSEFGINLKEDSENDVRNELLRDIYTLNNSELEYLKGFVKMTFSNYSLKKLN